MKKQLIITLTSFLISTYSFADGHIKPYAGVTALIGNKTELEETRFFTVDATSDAGYGFFIGAAQKAYPIVNFGIDINIGIDFEYQYIGEADLPENTAEFIQIAQNVSTVTMDAHTFFVNSRPMFAPPNENYYLAFVAGIGHIAADFVTPNGKTVDEGALIYQIGTEFGLQIKDFDLTVGYRFRVADLDQADLEVKGLIASISYRF